MREEQNNRREEDGGEEEGHFPCFNGHEEEEELDPHVLQSLEEVRQQIREEQAAIREREEQIPGWFSMQFGEWTFDPEQLLLVHGRGDYVIELDRINSSACMLDWIMQVHGKLWSTPEDIFCLLVAFRRILDPQKNFCAFEEHLEASGEELASIFAQKALDAAEESQRLEEFHKHANAILEMVPLGKNVPLSLITESLDIPHADIVSAIRFLHLHGVVIFDIENKYVSLNPNLSALSNEDLGCGDQEEEEDTTNPFIQEDGRE